MTAPQPRGAPITVHTSSPAQSGRLAVELFRSAGVDLSKVVIGHAGDSNDLDYLMELADSGATLGLDLFNPTASRVDGAVLDIRQDSEYAAGHLPHAVHIELGDLTTRTDQVVTGPIVVMCGHGERAMTAATLLQRVGHGAVSVLDGGAHDWAKATGNELEQQ